MNEQTISYERITVNYNKKPCYDIVFSKSFEELTTELSTFELENKKVCIITDSNVDTLFANEVFGLFIDTFFILYFHRFFKFTSYYVFSYLTTFQ